MVIYLSSLLLLFTIFWMGFLVIIFFYFFYIQKPHPLHIIKDYYFLKAFQFPVFEGVTTGGFVINFLFLFIFMRLN